MNSRKSPRRKGHRTKRHAAFPIPVSKPLAMAHSTSSPMRKPMAKSQPLHKDQRVPFVATKSFNRPSTRFGAGSHRNHGHRAKTAADIQPKPNGLAMLQRNWNNRKPYAMKRRQIRSLTRRQKLPKTEFKLLLDEQQMNQCYEPVKLYQLNKELMEKNVGTCRVEALTLMVSVPKGRKDLTEGPVQYVDDEQSPKIKPMYTVDPHMDDAMKDALKSDPALGMSPKSMVDLNKSVNPWHSLSGTGRKRGASLLSEAAVSTLKKHKSTVSGARLSARTEFESQKRKLTRRFSDDYTTVMKRNHKKSALQSMNHYLSQEDEASSSSSDSHHGHYTNNAHRKSTDREGSVEAFSPSQRDREHTISAIDIEQEWDDFDEIMTQDSLGIRLQAQLLMERKVMLREQQRAIREQIRKQQEEEKKLQQIITGISKRTSMSTSITSPSPAMIIPDDDENEESVILRHDENQNNNNNSGILPPGGSSRNSLPRNIVMMTEKTTIFAEDIPDIPKESISISTIDDLYGSFKKRESNKKRDGNHGNFGNRGITECKSPSDDESYGKLSNPLHPVITLELEQELKQIEDNGRSLNSKGNNNKKISYASYTSYGLHKLKSAASTSLSSTTTGIGIRNKDRFSSSVLPYHRSSSQNEALLRIIQCIEKMPKPIYTLESGQRIPEQSGHSVRPLVSILSNVIQEFGASFRQILFETKSNRYCTTSTTNSDSVSVAVSFVSEGDGQSVHTVNSTNSNNKDTVDIITDDKTLNQSPSPSPVSGASVASKQSFKVRLKMDTESNHNGIDINNYPMAKYTASALTNEFGGDSKRKNSDIANGNGISGQMVEDEHFLHSLLSGSDLLTDISFYNTSSILKHFELILRILCALPFGMQHQRERILATMLKKVALSSDLKHLQQRLLCLYWSTVSGNTVHHELDEKELNAIHTIKYKHSDFYLYNDRSSVALYSLSSIVDHQSRSNHIVKEPKKEEKGNRNAFIVENTKYWKSIIDALCAIHSNSGEIVLDRYYSLKSVPSLVFIPTSNRHHLPHHEVLTRFEVDGMEYHKVYQYGNKKVYDILGTAFHGDRLDKSHRMRFPFLLRVGIDCTVSERMRNVYDLINVIWSMYKYLIPSATVSAESQSEGTSIHNKILLMDCQSITQNVGIWKLKPNLVLLSSIKSMNSLMENVPDKLLFIHHFLVSSATIFVASYLMGLEWTEVLETCFVHNRFGDLYQMAPLSVLCRLSHRQKEMTKSVDKVLQQHLERIKNGGTEDDDGNGNNNSDSNGEVNVYLMHILKALHSLQGSYEGMSGQSDCDGDEGSLCVLWSLHVKRLLNILVFNVNESSVNEMKSAQYLDHSHLFHLIQIAQLLFIENGRGFVTAADIMQHFTNILHLEMDQ